MIDGESSKAVFRKCSSGDMTAVILIKTSPDLTTITLKELLLDEHGKL